MPDELASQMEPLKELLGALGFTIVTCQGYEADDILGTLAKACSDGGNDCVIATGDRDSLPACGGACVGAAGDYQDGPARLHPLRPRGG